MPAILSTGSAAVSPTTGRRWLIRVFLWLLLVQGFHFFEHCIQVVQQFWLNDPNGNGLLGNLADFELLHLGYNSFYLAVLLWVYAEVSLAVRPTWARHSLVVRLLAVAVAIQGYHEVEHVMRLLEVTGWLNVGPAADTSGGRPPGLLGLVVNDVLLHWAFNGIVEVLPAAAFVLGRFARLLD